MHFRKHLLLLLTFLMIGNILFAQKKSKKNQESEKESSNITKNSQIKSLTNEALFINAMQAKVLGNYNEAIFRFNTLLKEDPTNAAAYFQLAQLFYSQNSIDKSEANAAKALELNPKEEWYYVFLAHVKTEKGDFEGAANLYKELVNLNPTELDYLYDWVTVLEEDEKYDDAIEVIQRIEKITGLDEEIIVQKVNIYQKADKKTEALKEIQRLIDSDSTQFRYYGYLGDFYEKTGDIELAKKAYQKILDIDSGNILAYYSLSDLYKKADDSTNHQNIIFDALRSKDIAIEDKIQLIIPAIQEQLGSDSSESNKAFIHQMVDVMLETHPDDKAAFAFASESYYTFGETEKAINTLKELVKDTTTAKEIHIQYLSLLSELEMYDVLYDQAIISGKQFHEDPMFDFFAAFSSMLTKKYELSVKAYNAGLSKETNDQNIKLQLLAGLGDAESQLKNFEKAYEAYEKALEIDPNNATVLNNYAYYLSVQNLELDRAERMSRKSNLLNSNNAAFQDTYAWIQYQKGVYNDALIWIEKALQSAGDHPSADMLDHYGDILFKLNEKERALEFWKKSLEVDANQTEIAEKIKNLD